MQRAKITTAVVRGGMPDQFSALRGSRSLSKEEFGAHLALAIRVENVAVLLGTGASKCVGGQTMADIWAAVQAGHAADTTWLRDNHFLPDGEEEPNIELLLDQIEIACRDAERRQADSKDPPFLAAWGVQNGAAAAEAAE